MAPEVRLQMAHDPCKADKLSFIGSELQMVRCEGSAEECKGYHILMQHGAKPHTGGVAVQDEELVEARHLEHRPRGQGVLECLERRVCLVGPGKGILAQQVCQQSGDGAEIPDELPFSTRRGSESATVRARKAE